MEPPQIQSVLSTTVLTPKQTFQHITEFLQKQKKLLLTTPPTSQEDESPSDEEHEEEDPIKKQVNRLFEEDDAVGDFQEISERLHSILSTLPRPDGNNEVNVVVDTFVPSPQKDHVEEQTQQSQYETSQEDETIESEPSNLKQQEKTPKQIRKELKKAEKAKRKALEKAAKAERKAKEKAAKKAAKLAVKERKKLMKKEEKKRRKSLENDVKPQKRMRTQS